MTPEQRDKHVKSIEKIENTPRPQKWREIKKLMLELHPELKKYDEDFSQACKELRQRTVSSTASSKDMNLRNTMKLPHYLYQAIIKLDPEVMIEMSGRNHGHQYLIGKQLYNAFPEYRIARKL
jgi:hypothetical protein